MIGLIAYLEGRIYACLYMFWRIVPGVMQATLCSGGKLEKRYSPSFRDDHSRGKSDRKRKRGEEVLK